MIISYDCNFGLRSNGQEKCDRYYWILLLSRQLSFLGVVLSCVVYYSIVYYVCYVLVKQTASYGGENYGGKAGCKKENFNGCALS